MAITAPRDKKNIQIYCMAHADMIIIFELIRYGDKDTAEQTKRRMSFKV